jgi:hypothetical protein
MFAEKKSSVSWEGSNVSAIVGLIQVKVVMKTVKANLIQASALPRKPTGGDLV